MKLRTYLLASAVLMWLGLFQSVTSAHAESTISCPPGQYDMLDWMTMDSDLRGSKYMAGTANPLYTDMWSTKFYWTKSGTGYPWDIQLYDNNNIYLWITEYAWSNPSSYKKSTYDTNMLLTHRCATAGFPGSTIKVANTAYQIYTDCNHHTDHTLKTANNQVWGPYYLSLGGNLPNNMKALVVSYRYNCDSNYGNCGDKEEYYLSQRYGLVQWIHYALIKGVYQQQQKSVFNQIKSGTTTPDFKCF